MKPEQIVVRKIASWMFAQHRSVVHRFDLAADLYLTIGQAKANKQINHITKYPDLFVAEMRSGYGGLYVEVKAKRSDYLKRDNTLKKSDHLSGQLAMINHLRSRGYYATFGAGFEECRQIIDLYLGGNIELHKPSV